MPHGMGHLCGHSGSAVLVLSSPSSWYTSTLLTGRVVWEAEKCCLQQLKYVCVISIFLTQNPKHSTIPVTGRKINSVLPKTRTPDHTESPKTVEAFWTKAYGSEHTVSILTSNLQMIICIFLSLPTFNCIGNRATKKQNRVRPLRIMVGISQQGSIQEPAPYQRLKFENGSLTLQTCLLKCPA